jgi:hypothetical protein
MPHRLYPAERKVDAEIVAALQGLYPVRCGDLIELLPRQKVLDLIEERDGAGDVEAAEELSRALAFDGESAFQRSYSQMTSCRLIVRTSTLFRLMEISTRSDEGRDDILRRQLAFAIDKALEDVTKHGSEEKVGLVTPFPERVEVLKTSSPGGGWQRGRGSRPVGHGQDPLHCLEGDSLPPELVKTSRYFLKNLFRLNNLHGNNEFHHPPEVVEDYWEIVSPDQGIFEVRMVPARRELALVLFRTSRSFGLNRTDNEDYYGLIEFWPRNGGSHVSMAAGSRYEVAHERTMCTLRRLSAWRPEVVEGPIPDGPLAGIPRPLSLEGLRTFRSCLRRMSGVRAEVQFPIDPNDPFPGSENLSVLGFDLSFDREEGRFLIDEVPVRPGGEDDVALVIADKLLALSRRLCPRPSSLPVPDMQKMEAEVRALIALSEQDDRGEELARKIVAKITVLDYYESLVRYAYALSRQLIEFLEGEQEIVLAIPRPLLALLNEELGRTFCGRPPDGGPSEGR